PSRHRACPRRRARCPRPLRRDQVGEQRVTDGADRARIVGITLDEHTVVRRNHDIEHERAVAIFDLIEENSFRPLGDLEGPFHLHLSAEGNRLNLDIETPERQKLDRITLPLASFRKIVRDYFLICESYYQAIRKLSPSQIEAIDMGRRGLHDE